MYDTGKVVIGLLIFVGIFTAPIWYGATFGQAQAEVELLDSIEGECAVVVDFQQAHGEAVPESREERMRIARVEHMVLVDGWRDEVVREGARFRPTVAEGGAHRTKSLSNTCLGCHTNKAQFCDRCHDNSGVAPYCWDCHVDPSQVAGR